jgi:Mycothiol maleylpyruvate isomerase N-terminal domain/MDMPI C-terminal domain
MTSVHTSAENLAIVWDSIDHLCSGLADDEWELPTGCPGWTVKDHLSHLVDFEARAIGQPAPEHDPGPLPHLKNDLGRGPAAGEAVGYYSRFLPYVAAKRAAAPEGAKVVFRIGDAEPVAVEVAGGRGRPAADPADATVTLVMPVTTFAALAAGRGDVPDDVTVTGDSALGQRVLESMSLMP